MKGITMRILVAGGAGFIGSNLIETLLQKGYQIACVDNMSLGNTDNLAASMEHPFFTLYEGDICDREFLSDVFEKTKPEYVFRFPA